MSLDLTLPFEFDAVKTIENLPKYCDYCKFLLVEELCLAEDYRLLHYGKCSVIGKINKTVEHDVFLENVRVTNLPNEFSLPEGSLNIRLLTYSYQERQLQNNKFVEITGESVLFHTKKPPLDNHHIPLTSRGLLEQLSLTNNDEEYNKLLKYIQENYKPAIKVWFVQPINRAGDLIQRNLELRMLQEDMFFNRTFENPLEGLDFEEIISNFQEKFDEEQQEKWTKFWQKQGEELVLEKWNEKYKDYLKGEEDFEKNANCPAVEEEVEKPEEENVTEELKEENFDNTETETDLFNTEKTWDDLWLEHREEIYCEQYLIFTTIFYNYFLDLKNSCETPQIIKEVTEETENETTEGESFQITQELEQLKLLGLPTSFSGRSHSSRKKSPKTIHYSDFYSDSEMENDDSNDSDLEEVCEKHELETLKDNDNLHIVQQKNISKSQKRKRNRKLKNVPTFILEEKGLLKYWRKRFSLFSRFDEGIRLDRESWFSVTPEKVAKHLAERLKCHILVDGFCGSGGNAIQFAHSCDKVIAIDIDPIKLEMAKHNAEIYKVAHKIEFIVGDFLQLAAGGKLKADIVFLSPPWGGPKYKNKKEFDIEKFLLPVKASELIEVSRNVSYNIALFLPRNSSVKQIVKLAGIGNCCEIEHNYLDSRLVAITALYGEEILSKENK